VEIPAHIDTLRAEGEHMVAAVAVADPDSPVPTCPDWVVRDLVRHTGAVHRWATGYVTTGMTEPSSAGLDEVPADGDLVRWLQQGCTDLVRALVDAPDDLQCWTFLAAPSPRAMWARRQAHETAIHRVDAQLATGAPVTPCAPAFAADGIDELLLLFVPRRSAKLRTDRPASLAVRCSDVDAAWLLRMDADGVTATSTAGDDDVRADCTVGGAAVDLYLALWHRAAADDLVRAGDRAVLDQFSAGVRIR
jgi:uncharacterized protein (TIGR03083 family)